MLGPRGLVFHVPPANVDTIFIYSWLISALAGNRNIVRVSPRRSEVVEIICRVLRESLERARPSVRSSAIVIQYGHEREITEAISAASDMRGHVGWRCNGPHHSLHPAAAAREGVDIPGPLLFCGDARRGFLDWRLARVGAGEAFQRYVLVRSDGVFLAAAGGVRVGREEETEAAGADFLKLVKWPAQQR